jgi:hypothetical protein
MVEIDIKDASVRQAMLNLGYVDDDLKKKQKEEIIKET